MIVTTLGVLGSGLALIAIGQQQSERPMFALLGRQVSPVTIHQAFFIVFAVFVGLHLLARLVPAVFVVSGRTQHAEAASGTPGRRGRAAALAAALLGSVLAVVLVLPVPSWHHHRHHFSSPARPRWRRRRQKPRRHRVDPGWCSSRCSAEGRRRSFVRGTDVAVVTAA